MKYDPIMSVPECRYSAFHEELSRHIIHNDDAYKSAIKAFLSASIGEAEVEAACKGYWPDHWPKHFAETDARSIRNHMRSAITAWIKALEV